MPACQRVFSDASHDQTTLTLFIKEPGKAFGKEAIITPLFLNINMGVTSWFCGLILVSALNHIAPPRLSSTKRELFIKHLQSV